MKKTWKRIVLTAAALSLLVTGLAGCSPDSTGGGDGEKSEVSLFYSTSGINLPDGVSESDNPFLNAIAEQANVTFTDVTVPPYTDWQTKFNMIVTSGNMPDLVHSMYPDEVNRQGANGAFVELTDIIKNSPVLSKLYNEEMLDLMRDENGKIYGLRSLGSETPSSCYVRKDLIDEVNGGKMPSTPEEYYEFFKNIKAKYPDAVPMTTRGGLSFGHLLFYGYGVKIDGNGANWQYTDGKFINAFEAKHAREAVEFHKKLYDEGLLDKTFVTNKIQDENDRKYNKQLAVFPSDLRSVYSYIGNYINNGCPEAEVVPGIWPRVDDPEVDDANVYLNVAPVGIHTFSISSKAKDVDACVRVLEALVSEETRELTSWGREGIEYNVVDGEKVLDLEKSKETSYRTMYAMMFNLGSKEILDVSLQEQLALVPEEKREQYKKDVEATAPISFEQAEKVPAVIPNDVVKLDTETLAKLQEAYEQSKSIILKAITGEISMEEYDKQVSDFLAKYQFITDAYNEAYAKVAK